MSTVLVLAGIYYYFLHRNNKKTDPVESKVNMDKKGGAECQAGYFKHNGKCIRCPEGFEWNGSECKLKQNVTAEGLSKREANPESIPLAKAISVKK